MAPTAGSRTFLVVEEVVDEELPLVPAPSDVVEARTHGHASTDRLKATTLTGQACSESTESSGHPSSTNRDPRAAPAKSSKQRARRAPIIAADDPSKAFCKKKGGDVETICGK